MPKQQIPLIAWSRRFDQVLALPGQTNHSFSIKQILELLPVIFRLQQRARKGKSSGFDPVNFFNAVNPGPHMGVPLGGIGCGSITRGWRGDFLRWQLRAGFYHHQRVFADQFSVFAKRAGKKPQVQVLYTGEPETDQLSSWQWNMNPQCATYHALFPRAWTVYENPLPGLELICEQISPVIPQNYTESSYPVCVFNWKIKNTLNTPVQAGLMFTFQNGYGTTSDLAGRHNNRIFNRHAAGKRKATILGVKLKHNYQQVKIFPPDQKNPGQEIFHDPLSFAIATLQNSKTKVSCISNFDPYSDGKEIWEEFSLNGNFINREDPAPTQAGSASAAALAVSFNLKANETIEIPFALSWDMPIARFGFGSAYLRRYTRFYGAEGNSAPAIASDALMHFKGWKRAIETWQNPILKNKNLPDWYKMALFNELYYIVDSGTIWAYPIDQPTHPNDMGHFAYLEGHEYRMYNTYDVHFYASFALAMLWPELELALQRDIAKTVMEENPEMVKMVFSGKQVQRKSRGMVPHDIGWPDEDPWRLVNGYFFQNINAWKDLNPKFVLQVYRDYFLTRDKNFLKEIWPTIREAIQAISKYDNDGDGLIENSGFPDQTYDTWTVSGASAYTGGLWLACLKCAAAIAEVLGQKDDTTAYLKMYKKAQAAYESKLWNGQYFNYDSSQSKQHDSIMADQLAGQWYARACGLGNIVKPEHTRRALKTIFENNVMAFNQGSMGAVNGMRPNKKVDHTNIQSQEVWTGTTYALAAAMLQEGLQAEAWQTARGIVDTTYYRKGYWFQTPEAWNWKGDYRSLAYMRPLAIWAMQWALEKRMDKVICKQLIGFLYGDNSS